ncbi:allophanate hydrolase [Marinobacteraceae bacterium S3BR75-40.1]
MTTPIPPLDIPSLQSAYREGRLTPRALLHQLRARCEAFTDRNIWIHRLSDAELEPYLAHLEQTDPTSLPLYGIPFAIKDNIDLANIRTTAACEAFAYTPSRHAFVVEQLIKAGAIPLGKTNLDQFATGLVGTRSPDPWGPCHNSVNPEYIAGGSSSGSAVAVALGLVSFALGTDTAGSGRVPAAFNHIVGLKPSLGRLSVRGVVPACQSLDCVSIFARDSAQAQRVLTVADTRDPRDPWQRPLPAGRRPWPTRFRFGLPRRSQLDFDGDSAAEARFDATLAHLQALGGVPVEVDFKPFLESARLLYEGPWVSERYLATRTLIDKNPEALLPVTRSIIAAGKRGDAADAFYARYRLQALKMRADQCWQEVDLMVTPTTPTIYTLDEIEADPIGRNSRLGTYTNFMNLLDYAAVAVPAGHLDNGLPWGCTLFAPAFQDEALLALACQLHARTADTVGALDEPLEAEALDGTAGTIDVVVCGAHLEGLPLNHQLTDRGGILVAQTETAPAYRMLALAGGPPERPGLIRDTDQGHALPVEIWRLPADRFGSFVAGIPQPLGIGKVEMADGRWLCGFICEPVGAEGATDITAYGGWRRYVAGLGSELNVSVGRRTSDIQPSAHHSKDAPV